MRFTTQFECKDKTFVNITQKKNIYKSMLVTRFKITSRWIWNGLYWGCWIWNGLYWSCESDLLWPQPAHTVAGQLGTNTAQFVAAFDSVFLH